MLCQQTVKQTSSIADHAFGVPGGSSQRETPPKLIPRLGDVSWTTPTCNTVGACNGLLAKRRNTSPDLHLANGTTLCDMIACIHNATHNHRL